MFGWVVKLLRIIPQRGQSNIPVEDKPRKFAPSVELQASEVHDAPVQQTIHLVPKIVKLRGVPAYELKKLLGKGKHGMVFEGQRVFSHDDSDPIKMAVKMENNNGSKYTKPNEYHVYNSLEGKCKRIPKLHYNGQLRDWYVLIMDLLGQNLLNKFIENGSSLCCKRVAWIAVSTIKILQDLHCCGWCHGDIKPDNLVLGRKGTPTQDELHMVDFGLARKFRQGPHEEHIQYDQQPGCGRGTYAFSSVHVLLGRTSSRRDDLISLAYTLIFLLKGSLPWLEDDSIDSVCKKKLTTTSQSLCQPYPRCFQQFVEAVMKLKFAEEPKYDQYLSWFVPLLSEPTDSLVEDFGVGSKRERSQDHDAHFDETPKKFRLGTPTEQWISVCNFHSTMKQRYRCNVVDAEVKQHINKGLEDGFQVTAVACCNDLWSLIMDASSVYSEQIFTVSQELLPKNWILEHLKKGFCITCMAGSGGGSSLIVMSKNTLYSQQSYKVSDTFPYEWISRKWEEGLYVTSLTSASTNRWVVVMSRGASYIEQCVEIDFQYPSEGIQYRLDAGYRITSCAATADQVAMILSIPTRCPADETQETLRTTQFPSMHVEEKWNKSLYISAVAYGRTVI